MIFLVHVLLRYYFSRADEYWHWMTMSEDSGTDSFRLVALWISLVVIVHHTLDDLFMYVWAYIHKHTNGRELLCVLDYYI